MNNQPTYDQIFVAIETLLRSSGHCGHLVSVVDEANKYCYKTFDDTIGTVDKSFINDRLNFGKFIGFLPKFRSITTGI